MADGWAWHVETGATGRQAGRRTGGRTEGQDTAKGPHGWGMVGRGQGGGMALGNGIDCCYCAAVLHAVGRRGVAARAEAEQGHRHEALSKSQCFWWLVSTIS